MISNSESKSSPIKWVQERCLYFLVNGMSNSFYLLNNMARRYDHIIKSLVYSIVYRNSTLNEPGDKYRSVHCTCRFKFRYLINTFMGIMLHDLYTVEKFVKM